MLSEQIAALVQYGIDTGLTPECEKIYTTNLLLDLFQEHDYEEPVSVPKAPLEDILKDAVTDFIYREALATRKPVFCIVDDTIASKTKPSSRALHPIEDAYFHQSHLKGVFIQQAR